MFKKGDSMDRRVKYTKNIIKTTFLKKLEEKDINKITVSEICQDADVNRATFYRYYLDVYDLLDSIETEFVDNLRLIFNEENYTVYSFALKVLNIFLENKQILKVIFKSRSNINFMQEFLETAYAKCQSKWKSIDSNLTDEQIELGAIYIFNGSLGIINYWVQNDFSSKPEDIAEIISELSYDGIKKYIYKNL